MTGDAGRTPDLAPKPLEAPARMGKRGLGRFFGPATIAQIAGALGLGAVAFGTGYAVETPTPPVTSSSDQPPPSPSPVGGEVKIDVRRPFNTGFNEKGEKNPPYIVVRNVVTFEGAMDPDKITNSEGEFFVLENDTGERVFTQITGTPGKNPHVTARPDGTFVVDYTQS